MCGNYVYLSGSYIFLGGLILDLGLYFKNRKILGVVLFGGTTASLDSDVGCNNKCTAYIECLDEWERSSLKQEV